MTTESERCAQVESPARLHIRCIPRDFQMGEWYVQPSLGRLGHHGVKIRLRPQLMDVLCCLARRAGHTIGRDEIFSTVWPGQFVVETGLPRCIAELRQVFKDDARDPRVIETIPKRGYRLLPPVSWVADDAPSIPRGGVPGHRSQADVYTDAWSRADTRTPTNAVALASAIAASRDEAVPGAWGRSAGSTSGRGATRPASRWRWRRMTAWLTSAAASIRSFVV
jgi:DNA-binding winged helix-turn-helix (wHTH) protein